jgi:predicted alpha/beta superfamily hydrolase
MYNQNSPSNWSWKKAFEEMEKYTVQSELTQQCIMILGNSETSEYKTLSKDNQSQVYKLLSQIL